MPAPCAPPWITDALETSGLFDASYYASQAGLADDMSECVQHYLATGAAEGLSPNCLFDAERYLADYPDVRSAGMPAFLHFVAYGRLEGRRAHRAEHMAAHGYPPSSERLEAQRVLSRARAFGWTDDGVSRWHNRCVGVYASSLGQASFSHIADHLAAALRSDGVPVRRLDQSCPQVGIDVHLVVAPHEFFTRGGGVRWEAGFEGSPVIFMNTERPWTPGYLQMLRIASPPVTIIDACPYTAVHLADCGRARSGYLPLGWFASHAASRRGMTRRRNWCLSWMDRPIDVLFVGELTGRRSTALAQLAPALSQWQAIIHAPSSAAPAATYGSGLSWDDTAMLAGHSKIVLHIGADALDPLPWYDVVLLGIAHGSVVLAEPAAPLPGIERGHHFLSSPPAEMANALELLLATSGGATFARRLHDLVPEELVPAFDVQRELRALAYLVDEGR